MKIDINKIRRNEKGVYEMCTAIDEWKEDLIQAGIREGKEAGIKEGIREGKEVALKNCIDNLMESMKIPLDQALELLKVPEQERKSYRYSE